MELHNATLKTKTQGNAEEVIFAPNGQIIPSQRPTPCRNLWIASTPAENLFQCRDGKGCFDSNPYGKRSHGYQNLSVVEA